MFIPVNAIVESGKVPFGNFMGLSDFLQENTFNRIRDIHNSNILRDFTDSLFILQRIETDVKILKST